MRSPFPRWVDLALVLLFVLFVALVLGPSLIGRDLAIDVNLLTEFQPWKAVSGVAVGAVNTCRSDTVDTGLPVISEIRRILYSGHYPTWVQYNVGGAPIASPNNGQFSPLALPYYLVPLSLAPAFVKLAQFAAVLVGMVAFLRRLGLSIASGVLGAIVYCASGFMISWSNWPQTLVAALIPALFWSVERLAQERRARDAVPLALVVASMVLGGFPAVTGMALYLAAPYFLVRVITLHRGHVREIGCRLVLAVTGLAVGTLLTAFQLVPFAKQLADTDLSYRQVVKGESAPLDTLLTLVSPDAFGTCVGGEVRGVHNPIETIAFVGAAAVVLSVVAVLWSGRRGRTDDRAAGVAGFFVIAAATVVVVGWLGGPLLAALQVLPVFSNNSIWRIRSILGFVLAVLAAFGFERLVRHVSRARPGGSDPGPPGPPGTSDDERIDADHPSPRAVGGRWLRILGRVVVLAAFLGLGVAIVLMARHESVEEGFYPIVRDRIMVAAALMGATTVLVLIVRLAPRVVAIVAVLGVAGLVVGQSSSFGAEDIGGSDVKNFYPVTPTHVFLQKNLGEDRFASSNLLALPPTATYYDIRTPTGHQFSTPEWLDLLTAVDPKVAASPTFSDFTSASLPLAKVGRQPLLDRLSVKYWLSPDDAVSGAVDLAPAGDGTAPVDATHPATCTLPGGPVRGLVVLTTGPLVASAGRGASLSVSVRTADGKTVTGGRYLGPGLPLPTQISIAFPGEDLAAAGPLTVTVRADGVSKPVPLATVGGALSCGSVAAADDGLRLVDSEAGALVWERLSSLPRIRWAETTVVVPDPAQQVSRLAAGMSPDTIVVASGTATGPATPSATATPVTVDEDDGPTIRATVTAAAAGHLVVADSLRQPGWTASLDGHSVPLVAADHAFGAVAVPAGTHTVELQYEPPGLDLGVLLSLVGLVLLIGLLLADSARRWQQRRRAGRPRPLVPDGRPTS